jgi:hypothetical protein
MVIGLQKENLLYIIGVQFITNCKLSRKVGVKAPSTRAH